MTSENIFPYNVLYQPLTVNLIILGFNIKKNNTQAINYILYSLVNYIFFPDLTQKFVSIKILNLNKSFPLKLLQNVPSEHFITLR